MWCGCNRAISERCIAHGSRDWGCTCSKPDAVQNPPASPSECSWARAQRRQTQSFGNPSTVDTLNGLHLAADQGSLTEPARTAPLEHEIQVGAIESTPLPIEQPELVDEPKPDKARASRWARLGIFLCVALASAIIAAVVFVKGDPASVEDLTEKLTSGSLKLGLAAWAVSEAVAGRWLTPARSISVPKEWRNW